MNPVRDDIQHRLVEGANSLFFTSTRVTRIKAHAVVSAELTALRVDAWTGVTRGALRGGDNTVVVVAAIGGDGGTGVDDVALRR